LTWQLSIVKNPVDCGSVSAGLFCPCCLASCSLHLRAEQANDILKVKETHLQSPASVYGLFHFKSKTTSTRLQHRKWRSQALSTNRWFDNWQGLRSGVCGGQASACGGQASACGGQAGACGGQPSTYSVLVRYCLPIPAQ